ncbi:hypothetical protein K1T71_008016 [Dendrolimus kikuchii]|uniref:Uncharacterized protein n=1 Tax=Dendrolimus kikuchii TaxID=765133 RepID=A0ACC1CZ16_9NEOP|nr:hypothetical protein K1T71_008016 [Dendrolimus kikuchii]
MWRFLIFISALGGTFVIGMTIVEPGPQYPPTKGAVWPKPQQQITEDTYFIYNPADFNIKVTGQSCLTLTDAITRYSFLARDLHRTARLLSRKIVSSTRKKREQLDDEKLIGNLTELEVDLTSACEEYPYFGMVESYNLTISAKPLLQSTTIWGILRGLETWIQMFYITDDFSEVRINATKIIDYPQYAHRGVLLDTSRHYISVANILKLIDAIAINKMNVLHWHIVDDQSFPYESRSFPDLSRLGAYNKLMIYEVKDINMIIDHAKHRGVRIIPEFDVPGHTRSWGVAFPNILTKCYNGDKVIGLGPMDPTKNTTYKLLHGLISEVQSLFPDRYFHVGGDEVDLDCWKSNPDIVEYMKQNNLTSAAQLHALFMRNVIPLLGNKSLPIVWQEVFDENVPLSPYTIIQVWKGYWQSEIIRILSAGHKVIFSSAWYLDHLKSGGDWVEFYSTNPRKMAAWYDSDIDVSNIVGGEACMWGEVVDDNNVMSRIWPRASAVAEKLWSSETPDHPDNMVYRRLEEHACRMNRYGIKAQPPSGPGFCLGAFS